MDLLEKDKYNWYVLKWNQSTEDWKKIKIPELLSICNKYDWNEIKMIMIENRSCCT